MHNKAHSDLLRETEQAALSVLGLLYSVQFIVYTMYSVQIVVLVYTV